MHPQQEADYLVCFFQNLSLLDCPFRALHLCTKKHLVQMRTLAAANWERLGKQIYEAEMNVGHPKEGFC